MCYDDDGAVLRGVGPQSWALGYGKVNLILEDHVPVFGELVVLGIRKTRSATVRARTTCDVHSLHRNSGAR